MEIKLRKNERGFSVGEFKDLYGVPCSIQKSNRVADDSIWLGRDHGEGTLMQLDKERVAALLPLLERFVKTGELEG